jgi:hypothetical protein
MTTELENVLARELHEVADGVEVPSMPALVADPAPAPRPTSLWRPLLVAAVVALIVGVAALVLSRSDDGAPKPAPPGPTNATDPSVPRDTEIPTTMPTVPFILDGRLYVDGERVPGEGWWGLQTHAGVWLATQGNSNAWWWDGPGADGGQLEGQFDQPPVLSPNGGYIAYVDVSSGRAEVNGFTTEPAGEGFGLPLEGLPRTEDGVAIRVRAVTDDGDVIVQGARTSIMWHTRSAIEFDTVNLSETAPGREVLSGAPGGLVVTDTADGEPYLATISPAGELTRIAALPAYDGLEVSPGGDWSLGAADGTLGGEVAVVGDLRAQPVDGGDEVTLDPPPGWGFAVHSWTWEDETTFVAELAPADGGDESPRLARCSVALGDCLTLPGPGGARSATPVGPLTAEETLDRVIRAVVDGDREGLADPTVVSDADWDQLVEYAAGGDGAASTCRDNGEGTKDCGIAFDAARDAVYYAILAPADNDYGWRVTYVSIGGA